MLPGGWTDVCEARCERRPFGCGHVRANELDFPRATGGNPLPLAANEPACGKRTQRACCRRWRDAGAPGNRARSSKPARCTRKRGQHLRLNSAKPFERRHDAELHTQPCELLVAQAHAAAPASLDGEPETVDRALHARQAGSEPACGIARGDSVHFVSLASDFRPNQRDGRDGGTTGRNGDRRPEPPTAWSPCRRSSAKKPTGARQDPGFPGLFVIATLRARPRVAHGLHALSFRATACFAGRR